MASRFKSRILHPAVRITLTAAAAATANLALAQMPTDPLPDTLSAEGKAALEAHAKLAASSQVDEATKKAFVEQYQIDFGAIQQKRYPVDIKDATMGGVPVRLINAKDAPKTNLVMMNIHGGGWTQDSGSRTENIPIASLTKIPVVAVLYRLAPQHMWPANIDDALAVYKELLKTHKPSEIGVYGTSAGAVMGPQLMVRLKKEGLPLPAFLGMFSGDTDLTRTGDTMRWLGVDMKPLYQMYLGSTPASDNSASVALGPVDYFPPTLCMTSARDFYLSGTVNFCRQLENAGVENKLVVFDALPHAFWSYLDTPESDQAFAIQAKFFNSHLKK